MLEIKVFTQVFEVTKENCAPKLAPILIRLFQRSSIVIVLSHVLCPKSK